MPLPASITDSKTLVAPDHWRCVDFISDLHLQAAHADTYATWVRYMSASDADAIFILGDLFEAWVGDDVLDAAPTAREPIFEQGCQDVLKRAAQRASVYFIRGNRDFLLDQKAAQACSMQLLDDPCCLVFDKQRWLLSHGDELCTADRPYQAFRAMVRGSQWQQDFLARSLQERQGVAREMRAQSEARKTRGEIFFDVDSDLALRWLSQAQAQTLIHGHTHRPAEHALSQQPLRSRWVLSDWDASAQPPRLEVLRLCKNTGLRRLALDAAIKT